MFSRSGLGCLFSSLYSLFGVMLFPSIVFDNFDPGPIGTKVPSIVCRHKWLIFCFIPNRWDYKHVKLVAGGLSWAPLTLDVKACFHQSLCLHISIEHRWIQNYDIKKHTAIGTTIVFSHGIH